MICVVYKVYGGMKSNETLEVKVSSRNSGKPDPIWPNLEATLTGLSKVSSQCFIENLVK